MEGTRFFPEHILKFLMMMMMRIRTVLSKKLFILSPQNRMKYYGTPKRFWYSFSYLISRRGKQICEGTWKAFYYYYYYLESTIIIIKRRSGINLIPV